MRSGIRLVRREKVCKTNILLVSVMPYPSGGGDTHPVILDDALTLQDALFLERKVVFRNSSGPHSQNEIFSQLFVI
jgi:hypothetical protein